LLAPTKTRVSNYWRIARPDHWIKNIFVLPGAAAAVALVPGATLDSLTLSSLALALVAVSLAASANYTVNEFLDADTDKHHPLKHSRPGALGMLDGRIVFAQYCGLAVASLILSFVISVEMGLVISWLLAMGVFYNVRPIRSKDRAYIDVLSESINNPIRFLAGWFAISPVFLPPVSALLAYWMGGAFLMAVKRYSEYRRIDDRELAALYRRSFAYYSEKSLLLSAFFYALCSTFFIGVFLIKYRVGLVLTFPMFAALFTLYLDVGLREDSAAQAPEKLYRETWLLLLAAATFFVAGLLFVFDMPILRLLTDTHLVAVH
jgi:4-hydroxybenzoate polyprenyltransferase